MNQNKPTRRDFLSRSSRTATTLLNAADREIDLFRRELEALKKQKKGLMQKLLTGQVRVRPAKGGA